MFHDFLRSYTLIEQAGTENSLYETLRLFDLLSSGALRGATLTHAEGEQINLELAIQKRKKGMPWEYILGKAHFMGRMFFCTPDTLIPTDETRVLVNAVLESLCKKESAGKTLTLIEVGTGCGNIAVSIALQAQQVSVLASDISSAAVEIARRNVAKFKLEDRISLAVGDLFAPYAGVEYEENIDCIVCNPPYIPTSSLSKLSAEIIDHEPLVALDGGPYGINIYRRLITDAQPLLKPDGVLLFEIGERQETLVTRVIEKSGGYQNIEYFKDGDKIRAIRATKKRTANHVI